MKKIIASILAGAALFACHARAQTNLTTWNDIAQAAWDKSLGSSNMVYAPFFERKLTGNADGAGVLGLYNFSDNVAAGIGFLHQWQPSGGEAASSFSIAANVQLKATINPFSAIGWTWFRPTIFGGTAVGTPLSGDNHGNLMNNNLVGAVIPIHTWTVGKAVITVAVEGFYSNQTGSGYYDGNWAGGGPAGGWSTDGSLPAAARVGISF